jgi:protoporphyrinogen oxidase
MGQVAIIGAGVSGLACALVLKEHKIDFEIFEASARPGGHARTNAVGNFRFDHGPHVLVGIPEPVLPLFSSLDLELRACSCNSSIYFRRNTHRSAYVPAPIQHNLAQLPLSVRISCVVAIRLSKRRIEFSNGRECHYDFIVSSIPLIQLVQLIDAVPPGIREAAEDLAYGSTYVFNIGFDRLLGGPHGIIRYPEHVISFYRLSFPGAYAAGAVPEGQDAVIAEVAYHPKRHPRSAEEVLIAVHADLRATGIACPDAKVVAEQTVAIPISHVVHTGRTSAALRLIRDWLEHLSIHCCGKYGEWRELLMTQSMLSGQRAAVAITQRMAEERSRSSAHC